MSILKVNKCLNIFKKNRPKPRSQIKGLKYSYMVLKYLIKTGV